MLRDRDYRGRGRGDNVPGSFTETFSDVERFRNTIRPADTEFLVTGRGAFSATVTKVDLINLGLQRLTENLARTWRIAIDSPRIAVIFAAEPGAQATYRGAEFAEDCIGFVAKGTDVWHRSSGASSWAGYSLPDDLIVQHSVALFGRDLTPPRNRISAQLPSATMARLRRLHAAVIQLGSTAPEIISNIDAAKGLEASLIETFFDCLSSDELDEDQSARRQHFAILRKLHDLAQENPEEPLYISDVCRILRVPKRTLQYSCNEQLGMSPKKYLTLRRLHLVHQALQRGSEGGHSVSDIAMRFGFWELGRFAIVYRTIYGETPSATLRARQRLLGPALPRRAPRAKSV
jgi:AraC-like DNA-binding protein